MKPLTAEMLQELVNEGLMSHSHQSHYG